MLLPSVVIKHSAGGAGLAGCFCRGAAAEGLVNAASVVINSERFELLLKVDGVPEEYAIEILAPVCRPPPRTTCLRAFLITRSRWRCSRRSWASSRASSPTRSSTPASEAAVRTTRPCRRDCLVNRWAIATASIQPRLLQAQACACTQAKGAGNRRPGIQILWTIQLGQLSYVSRSKYRYPESGYGWQ